MSPSVRAALDAMTAEVVKIHDPPARPWGYGSDLSCGTDLDPMMAEVDGFSTLALGQAAVRRLTTARGSLPGTNPDSKDYGMDLRAYLNRGATTADLASLGRRVEKELLKDDRFASVTADVQLSDTDDELAEVSIQIVPKDPALDAFDLVLAVTSAGVLIKELRG